MNTTDRYAKIREALEMRPTPGPWTYDRRGDRKMEELPKITTVAYCCDYVIGLPSRYPGGDYRYDPSGSPEADTAFIAACDPDTIRDLLAERDALEAEIEALRAEVDMLTKAAKTQSKRHPYNASGSLSEYGVFPECDAQQPAEDEVVFIDGVGAGRSSIKSCRDGVQWIMVGDRVYWPLSDSDAKRLQSACCGNGSFDGPASPAVEGEQQ